MMDDVKADEGEEGEVDENGLPVSNKRVSYYNFLNTINSLILIIFLRNCIGFCNSVSVSGNCRRPAAWTGGGGEL